MNDRNFKSTTLRGRLRYRVKRIELHRLSPTLDGRFVELVGFQIKSGSFCGTPRENENAVIVLGQAFESRGRVHGISDRGDDLRTRWPHSTDDGFPEMDAHADAQRVP